jgi:class 3 adenylate cyclase
LVLRLNEIFNVFDEIVTARGLEKIKTIGDSYMLAAGIPTPRSDHADVVVDASLTMLAAMERLDYSNELSLRVGINTGPVIAGVIGKSKFIYDLWGDTVNVASRLESQGLPSRIQISESTRRALTYNFSLKLRNPAVIIKGKGEMTTYFLEERRTDTIERENLISLPRRK